MKTFLNSIRILSVAAVLAVGVSYVFAFTEPSTNPPSNTATPIHTGSVVQEKKGGIWSKKVVASPISIFKKSIFLPGNKSALRIGSNDNATGNQTFTKGSAGAITQDLNTALFGEDDTVPLVIDLYSRPQPQDAIEFKTDLACPIVTRFTNNKAAAFEFKKEDGSRANIIARQVKLTGGDPDTNDVLVGDASGNARWAKASVVNGQVVFSPGTSPIPAGQCATVNCNDPVATNYNQPGACTYSPAPVCGSNVNEVYTSQASFNSPLQHNTANDCSVGTLEDSLWINGQATWNCVSGTQSITCSTAQVMSACFTSDTKITMADGSHKDIQNIQVGDKLKAVSGTNTVLKLLRPKLGNQPVYSINGGRDFFTANHPFLTTAGWKSIDPETTRKEVPNIKVSKMKVGDILITEKGNIIVKELIPTSASSDTQLFNFELDGDHTYYADGYAVHNKQFFVEGVPIQCESSNDNCSNYILGYCESSSNTCAIADVTCNSNADCIRPGGQQGQCVVYNYKGTVPPSYYEDKYCIY